LVQKWPKWNWQRIEWVWHGVVLPQPIGQFSPVPGGSNTCHLHKGGTHIAISGICANQQNGIPANQQNNVVNSLKTSLLLPTSFSNARVLTSH